MEQHPQPRHVSPHGGAGIIGDVLLGLLVESLPDRPSYAWRTRGESRPVSAQKREERVGLLPPHSARRRRHDPAARPLSLSDAATRAGWLCPGTRAAVAPGRRDCWRRIVPGRPCHASRYSACLPPSCAPPWSATARPEAGRAKTCAMVQMALTQGGDSGVPAGGYLRHREYPQPPPPSKITTRRTINTVAMSPLTPQRSRTYP